MEKAGNILNQLLSNLLQKKQNKGGKDYYHFFNKWEHMVGRQLYGHTKIIDIKNKNLIIAVDHPGWLQILKLKERRIIKKVQKMFPQLTIKSMRISVREECFKVENVRDKNEKEEENGVPQESMIKFDKIKDEQLKNILKRLYMSLIKKEEES